MQDEIPGNECLVGGALDELQGNEPADTVSQSVLILLPTTLNCTPLSPSELIRLTQVCANVGIVQTICHHPSVGLVVTSSSKRSAAQLV